MQPIAIIPAMDIHGEGPLWNPVDGRLWWTDVAQRRLRRLDPATQAIDDIAMPERVGSFAFIEGDDVRIVCAFESGVGVFNLTTKAIEWIARPEPIGTGRRFNDGRVDRQGRFWTGTMVEDTNLAAPSSAALWRLDADGRFEVQQDDVEISNGLCSSPDGRILYFADSTRQLIYAYDLDPASGAISQRRVFVKLAQGYPDGSAVDSEGHVWNAQWGAAQVVRYAPDGRIVRTIALPVSQPSCVAFGGDDYKTLFITTTRLDLSETELTAQPLAGSIFVFRTDVAGLPDTRYRWLKTKI